MSIFDTIQKTDLLSKTPEMILDFISSLNTDEQEGLFNDDAFKEALAQRSLNFWSLLLTKLPNAVLSTLLSKMGSDRLNAVLLNDHDDFFELLGDLPTEQQTILLAHIDINHQGGSESGSEDEDEDEGNSPLLISAILNKNVVIARLLMANGAPPDLKGQYGATPLSAAAAIGCMDIVMDLLQKKVNLEEPDNVGNTALSYAIRESHYDIAFTLLNNGALLDLKKHSTLLVTAINDGFIDLAILLIERGACLDYGGQLPTVPEKNNNEKFLTIIKKYLVATIHNPHCAALILDAYQHYIKINDAMEMNRLGRITHYSLFIACAKQHAFVSDIENLLDIMAVSNQELVKEKFALLCRERATQNHKTLLSFTVNPFTHANALCFEIAKRLLGPTASFLTLFQLLLPHITTQWVPQRVEEELLLVKKDSSTEATNQQSGLQHQITTQEPLFRHCVTPSPHAWGEGNKEGSYLEDNNPLTALPIALKSFTHIAFCDNGLLVLDTIQNFSLEEHQQFSNVLLKANPSLCMEIAAHNETTMALYKNDGLGGIEFSNKEGELRYILRSILNGILDPDFYNKIELEKEQELDPEKPHGTHLIRVEKELAGMLTPPSLPATALAPLYPRVLINYDHDVGKFFRVLPETEYMPFILQAECVFNLPSERFHQVLKELTPAQRNTLMDVLTAILKDSTQGTEWARERYEWLRMFLEAKQFDAIKNILQGLKLETRVQTILSGGNNLLRHVITTGMFKHLPPHSQANILIYYQPDFFFDNLIDIATAVGEEGYPTLLLQEVKKESLLHRLENDPRLVSALWLLRPDNYWTVINSKDSYNCTLLKRIGKNYDGVHMVLGSLEKSRRWEAISQKYPDGTSLFDNAMEDPVYLEMVLSLLNKKERREAGHLTNRCGRSVLFQGANFDCFITFLSLLDEDERWDALNDINTENRPASDTIVTEKNLLKVLNLLPKDKYLLMVSKKDNYGGNALIRFADKPPSLQSILKALPIGDRLAAVNDLYSATSETIFQFATRHNPAAWSVILHLLPDTDRLPALQANGGALLAKAAKEPDVLTLVLDLLPKEDQMVLKKEASPTNHYFSFWATMAAGAGFVIMGAAISERPEVTAGLLGAGAALLASSYGFFANPFREGTQKQPNQQSGLQHQITTQEPLFRPMGTFSPCLGRRE